MKNDILFALAAASLGIAAVGCSSARTPEQYAGDTRALLETKGGDIKACYDEVLKGGDHKTAGAVTVHFTVQNETGKIVGAQLDPNSPPALGACVMKAIDGLVLTPADPNDGIATYVWDFTVGPPPPAPKS